MEWNSSFPVKVQDIKPNVSTMEKYRVTLFICIFTCTIFLVNVILPMPCSESTSLGGDAEGFYLMQVYSCIYHRHKAHNRQTDVFICICEHEQSKV